MSIFQDRKNAQIRRDRLRNEGKCISCGANDATVNKDGTQSVHCAECKGKQTKKRMTRPAAPQIRYDDTPYDYRDERWYKKEGLLVRAVFERATRPLSIGDIRREMGDEFPERHIWDHIEGIDGLAEVRLHRWQFTDRRVVGIKTGIVKQRSEQAAWQESI